MEHAWGSEHHHRPRVIDVRPIKWLGGKEKVVCEYVHVDTYMCVCV